MANSKMDWTESLDKLKAMQKMHEKDLEEVTYMIECYEAKIAQLGQ
jgi:hypothetical protein